MAKRKKRKRKQNPLKMDGLSHPGFRDERLQCKSCSLLFLAEESALKRFSRSHHKCARCVAVERSDNGALELPRCFGKSYDNVNKLCSELCTLKQACIIQFADGKITNWKLNDYQRSNRKPTFRVELVRILRVAQQPLHIRDLMALLSKVTIGRISYNRPDWRTAIAQTLQQSDQVVSLGHSYYIWLGIWNPDVYDGVTGYYVAQTSQLSPMDEFFLIRKTELKNKPTMGLKDDVSEIEKKE